MPDRRTPFVNAGERETLVAFLDYLRDAVVVKAEGLSEDDARCSLVPSGTSVLGLVKHLTMVEVYWVQISFAGLSVSTSDVLEPADTCASVIAEYREAIGRTNEIVAAASDVDVGSARRHGGEAPMSLRWVLVHLIEETARHAGHADILREQLDGVTGR
jgi:hypothetical protein